jgi:type I restriction enzyme S subunit
MSQEYKKVALSEVLQLSIDAVPVDNCETYPISGVYSYGRGLFARQPLSGTETTYKFFHKLHEKDFVLSQLKGWEGALAKVTLAFEGWFLSPQFASFRVIDNKLDINFLDWYCKQSKVWEELKYKSSGMGARRDTVSPKKFLSIEIPLPPLDEQRRIVAQIEELAAKVEEARGLRSQANQQLKAFVSSVHLHLGESRTVKLSEILELDERSEIVQIGQKYPQVGVKGFGGGLFTKEVVEATQTTYKAFNRLYEGAIVLSQVKGWEGAIAGCNASLVGRYVSPEYRTFCCIEGQAIPGYISALVITPWFWNQLKNLSRGLGGRRERIHPEQFLQMEVPMPNIDLQKQALESFSKLSVLEHLQTETAAELDALLPSILDKAFKGEL